ncbi:unnamed protein product [Cercospora beticola]|nr:unnamed protein product [Cercospora beticola]
MASSNARHEKRCSVSLSSTRMMKLQHIFGSTSDFVFRVLPSRGQAAPKLSRARHVYRNADSLTGNSQTGNRSAKIAQNSIVCVYSAVRDLPTSTASRIFQRSSLYHASDDPTWVARTRFEKLSAMRYHSHMSHKTSIKN